MGIKAVSNCLIILGFIFILIVIFGKTSQFVLTFGVIFGFLLVIVGYMIKGPLKKTFEQSETLSSEEYYE